MVIGSKKMCTSTNQVMMTETVTVALDLWMLHPHLITLTSLHIYLSHTIADLSDIFKIQLQTSTTSPMTSGASYLLLASLYSGPWYESPSSCHPYKNPHYVHNPSIWFQVYLTFYLSFLVTNDNIYWVETQTKSIKWNESTQLRFRSERSRNIYSAQVSSWKRSITFRTDIGRAAEGSQKWSGQT